MASINKKQLTGGTEGEPDSNFSHPFFHNEIKAIQLLGKNTYGIRILPAFDFSLLEQGIAASDPQFKLSVVPYRDANSPVESAEDHLRFTPWYFTVKGYKFVGNDQKHFLSPLTMEKRDNRGIDPLFDIFFTAKNSGNPDWVCLTTKPAQVSEGYSSVIPLPKRFGIANALVHLEKTDSVENRIIVFGSACLDMLKATLNTLRPAIVNEPIDPDWPNYLFGDVTSPAYGSWATVKKTVFNTAGMADAGFHFSSKKDQLVGRTPWPIDVAADWGIAYLNGRENVGDTEKVTRIWSAEEILDFLVSDGFLPYELIEAACKNKWTVPPESGNPTHSLPPEGGGSFGGVPATPKVATARPTAPGAPAGAVAPKAAVRAPGAAAPRVAAPAANTQPRPPAAATGGAPRPPGAAASSAPRPPVGGQAAAPRSPGGPAQRPAAVKPAPAPAVVAPPVDEVTATEPVTQEEVDEFNALQDRFSADPESLSQEEIQRYGLLGDRVSQLAQQ